MGARILLDGSREVSCVETATCPHHNTLIDLYTPDGRKRELPCCRKCLDKRGRPMPVCNLCVVIESKGGDSHVPFETKLDRFEKALEASAQRQALRKAAER